MSTKVVENQSVYGDINNIEVFNQSKGFKIQKNTNTELSYSKQYLQDLDEYEKGNFNPSNLNLSVGDIVTGYIYNFVNNEMIVDINAKDFVYISLDKDKLDKEDFSIGQEVEFLITQTKGSVKGSIADNFKAKIYRELKDDNCDTIYTAKVLELSENGYILDIKGLKVFMPGSLGGINKLLDFNSLIGKEINVIPVANQNKYSNYSEHVIVSHREYLKTLIPEELDKLTIGSVYTGKVTDTAKFGIFVEFNNVLTGLIHKDEFDTMLKELFEQEQVKPGVEIDFYLKSVDDKGRIVLTRNVESLNQKQEKPKFKKGEIVEGIVSKEVTYGLFVKLNDTNSGLVHISKIKNVNQYTKGDKIKVKILSVEDNKINLDLV